MSKNYSRHVMCRMRNETFKPRRRAWAAIAIEVQPFFGRRPSNEPYEHVLPNGNYVRGGRTWA